VVGVDGVGHQLLGLRNDALRLAPVVEAVEGEDVGGEDTGPDDVQHPRVDAAALLVAGRPEDDVAATAEGLQGLQDGYT
jgi:hypothetical protein